MPLNAPSRSAALPGALRNGAPFKDWILPAGLTRVRQKLGKSDDADRQMVKILTAVLTGGLPAVEAACGEALDDGVHSADVILNILVRDLTSGNFLDHQRNGVLVGGTDTGSEAQAPLVRAPRRTILR